MINQGSEEFTQRIELLLDEYHQDLFHMFEHPVGYFQRRKIFDFSDFIQCNGQSRKWRCLS